MLKNDTCIRDRVLQALSLSTMIDDPSLEMLNISKEDYFKALDLLSEGEFMHYIITYHFEGEFCIPRHLLRNTIKAMLSGLTAEQFTAFVGSIREAILKQKQLLVQMQPSRWLSKTELLIPPAELGEFYEGVLRSMRLPIALEDAVTKVVHSQTT